MSTSELALVPSSGQPGSVGKGAGSQDPTIRLWLRDQRRRNLSPGTIAKRASAARRLVAHAGKPILEVTRDDIEAWLDDRPDLAARTRYCEISHISAFFTWAIREEHCDIDPTMRVTRPKVSAGLPRPIATEDLRLALDQAPTQELLAMMTLAAFGGLRCIEISRLDVSDILDRHNPPVMLLHGKGNKDRLVPIHPIALAEIRRHGLPARGRVFPGRTPTRISNLIRCHLHDCDIRASAHQLRHWFATQSYDASGGDLRMVQDLLGHASPATTAIYTRWRQSKAMQVVERLDLDPDEQADPPDAA